LGKRLVASIEKITATEAALMRDVSFTRYTFILHFLRRTGAGGMEHANGTAISLPTGGLGERWPELEVTLAHEFFHLWNVKRIRPQGLEPIDYTRGNDTSELWFSEGVTSTYQELVLLRAGMITRLTFYARLAAEIAILERRPSRHWQSVEQSGREAWLEKYRRYNRPGRSISYYNKGALVGFLLDLGIRHASHNQHSLDDLMRRLDQDFARRGRFLNPADLQAIVAELAPGFPVDAFFRDYVSGTRDLDYETYVGYAGLCLTRQALDRGRTAYRIEEIPDAAPDQLQVRDGWLEGK
jgi:predicted metalloprotease with PDZ domain